MYGNDSLDEDDQELYDLLSTANSQEGGQGAPGGISPNDVSSNATAYKEMRNKADSSLQRHRPILKRSERALEDETYDRSPAAVGPPDKSKLIIVLNRERVDEDGNWHRVPPASYVYMRNVVWNDKESVTRLNQWRCQIFRRALGAQRNSRQKWTIAEHDTLMSLLSSCLQQASINGRWARIPWSTVRTEFNSSFEGHIFPKGEPLALITKKLKKDKRGNNLMIHRHDTRFFPRSLAAIMCYLNKSTNADLQQLVAKARDLDAHDRLQGFVGGNEEEAGLSNKRPRVTKKAAAEGQPKKSKTTAVKPIRKTKTKTRILSKTTPKLASDDAINVAKKARARKPAMIEAPAANTKMSDIPKAYTFTGTEPFPNVPTNAADMMRVPSIINPPSKHFFRHIPKSMTAENEDADITEDEIEYDIATREHAFVSFVRSVRLKEGSGMGSISPARPLSPFKDLDKGGVKQALAGGLESEMKASPLHLSPINGFVVDEAQEVRLSDTPMEMLLSTYNFSSVNNTNVGETRQAQSTAVTLNLEFQSQPLPLLNHSVFNTTPVVDNEDSHHAWSSFSRLSSPINDLNTAEIDQAPSTTSFPARAGSDPRPLSPFEALSIGQSN